MQLLWFPVCFPAHTNQHICPQREQSIPFRIGKMDRVISLKFWQHFNYLCKLFLKCASLVANSADLVQTGSLDMDLYSLFRHVCTNIYITAPSQRQPEYFSSFHHSSFHLLWPRWLSWMLVRLETRRSRVRPLPRSASEKSSTFYRGDWSWSIFYGHSLPSADSRRAVVAICAENECGKLKQLKAENLHDRNAATTDCASLIQ